MAEATSTFQAGWNGTVIVAPTGQNMSSGAGVLELPITRWNLDRSVAIQRFRNSRTNHNTVIQPTFPSRTGTAYYDLDVANEAAEFFGVSAVIVEGAAVELNLVVDKIPTPNVGWNVPIAIITRIMDDVVIDGKYSGQFQFEISGGYAPIAY